jgi:uncharacterized protein (TIGR00255 family)
MTGFGVADGTVAGGRLHVEIRTVNHRHFSVQFKTPHAFNELEAQLREALRARIDRGHVSFSARWAEEPPRHSTVQVNEERARDVLAALTELQSTLGLGGLIDVALIARQPEVLTMTSGDAPAPTWDEVAPVVDAALNGLIESRDREGAVLTDEVLRRTGAIRAGLAEIEARAPERVIAERDRLRNAVVALTEGVAVNEDRIAHEIAILADRLDVTEETVRLAAHLDAVEDALGEAVPVGKLVGFLGQEMLREINTIGSKANDASIAHTVVGMKGELEKFREQIENLE